MKQASLALPNVLPLLLRRKMVVGLSALAGAILSYAVAQVLPVEYAGQGALVVDTEQLSVPELSIGGGPPTAPSDTIATQIDVIRSRSVVERVVARLHLATATGEIAPGLQLALRLRPPLVDTFAWIRSLLARSTPAAVAGIDPADGAIDYIRKNLHIVATDHSRVMSIRFVAGDRQDAADVVNALMTEYLAVDVAVRRAQQVQINEWLTERSSDLLAQVNAAEGRVSAFLRDHDAQQVQGSSAAALQLSKDQAQLALARLDLGRQLVVLDSLHRPGTGGGFASAAEVLASPTIQSLRQREAQLLIQIAPMSPTDPRRVALQAALDSVRAQTSGEVDKIVSSLAQAADVGRANIRSLEAAVARDTEQSRAASVAEINLARLKWDVDAKRQMYQSFLVRAENTRLAAAQLPSARIVAQATPARQPVFAFGTLSMIFGLAAGFMTAAAAILLSRVLSTRIVCRSDMAITTGLPVVGCLPDVRMKSKRDILSPRSRRSASLVAETLRAVWLAMESAKPGGGGTTVLVTSSEVGEGKTTVAIGLARRIAADGFRVLLIDSDLRRPSVASVLKLEPFRPLEAVLTGDVTAEDAIVREPVSGLDCLLAAGNAINPLKMLASGAFKALLDASRQHYDFTVLDSPPVLRVADAILISQRVQLTLFVVQSGRVPGDLVSEAIQRFPKDNQSRIQSLLTRVRPSRLEKGDYYGGYGTLSGDVAPAQAGPGTTPRPMEPTRQTAILFTDEP